MSAALTQNKVRWELYSDHNGKFAQRVPAEKADYAVSADLKGYKLSDGRQVRLIRISSCTSKVTSVPTSDCILLNSRIDLQLGGAS